MRKIVIVVEGSKDAYFLHELILQRFSGYFLRQDNHSAESEKQVKPMKLVSKDGGIAVDLYWVSGYGQIKNMKNELIRSADIGAADEFVSGLVFDSDVPPEVGANEKHAGHGPRSKEILKLLKIPEEKWDEALQYVFLFPDNEGDGDLEVVLRAAVRESPEHQSFFEKCWTPFEDEVGRIPANVPTRKSMMNEYKAAFDSQAWDTNGLNLNFARAGDLWNWSAPQLEPLVDFLGKLLTGPATDGLGACLI